jgi:hypothetical protein
MSYKKLQEKLDRLRLNMNHEHKDEFDDFMNKIIDNLNEEIAQTYKNFNHQGNILAVYGCLIDSLLHSFGDVSNAKGITKEQRKITATFVQDALIVIRETLKIAEQTNNRNLS